MRSCSRPARHSCSFVRCLAVFLLALMVLGAFSSAVYAAPVSPEQAKKEKAAKAKAAKDLAKAKALSQKAKVAIRNAAFDRAVTYLETATQLAPQWSEGWHELAVLYVKLRNYANAAKAYRHLSALHPNDYGIKREYGKCLVENSQYDEAQEIWQKVIEKNPSDAEASYYLASIAYSQERYKDAAKLAEDALILDNKFYRAVVLQIKIDLRGRHYFDANKRLQYIRENLEEGSPLRAEAEALEEPIKSGLTSLAIIFGICALMILAFIIAAIYARRVATRVKIKAPPEEMDAMANDSICTYVMLHLMNITRLPRGLCWVVSVDGRHMILELSELINDPSNFSLRPFNRNNMEDFIETFGKQPFYYKGASQDALFKDTFPNLVEDLHGIEMNVVVPLVWESNLLGIILLGRSRNTEREQFKQRFEEGMERMQMVIEEGSAALDRLRQRHIKEVDTRTGLWNRDYFETKIVEVSRGCYTVEIPMCAFMVTLDQVAVILETHDEDFGIEFLYQLGGLMQNAISKEPDVTLCHLDGGVFGVIAQGMNAEDGMRMARTLQTFMAQAELPEEMQGKVTASGLVAWTLFPEDSKDPKMLRAILTRAFRDARVQGGNRIVRAEKVEEATKASAVQVIEQAPEEKMVIRRSAVRKQSDSMPYLGIPSVPDNNPPVTAAPAAAPADEAPIRRRVSGAVTINLSNAGVSGGSSPLHMAPSLANPTSPAPGRSGQEKVARIAAPVHASSPSKLQLGKAPAPSKPAEPFTIVPKLDDEGIDADTQFCGEETFMSIVDNEIGMANESGEECAIVYMHFTNLQELRNQGKEAYMKLRKEVAAVIGAFLRDDDIPGLIGEDDMAVFMIGTNIDAASHLAERIKITTANMNGLQIGLGVALRKPNTMDCKTFIDRARGLAGEVGIHSNAAAK